MSKPVVVEAIDSGLRMVIPISPQRSSKNPFRFSKCSTCIEMEVTFENLEENYTNTQIAQNSNEGNCLYFSNIGYIFDQYKYVFTICDFQKHGQNQNQISQRKVQFDFILFGAKELDVKYEFLISDEIERIGSCINYTVFHGPSIVDNKTLNTLTFIQNKGFQKSPYHSGVRGTFANPEDFSEKIKSLKGKMHLRFKTSIDTIRSLNLDYAWNYKKFQFFKMDEKFSILCQDKRFIFTKSFLSHVSPVFKAMIGKISY